MNWEAIKKIYIEVLVHGARIEYMGHGECETVRLFNENLISIKYNEFNYYRYVDYAIKYFSNNKYTKRSYYQDGTKKWKTQYKNGLRHGISVGWNYTGRKIYNQKYINGVPISMKARKTMSNRDEIKDASLAVVVGAAVGAGLYTIIMGVGFAGLGTAVGITLLPMVAVGASLAGLGYGLFRLGKGKKDG